MAGRDLQRAWCQMHCPEKFVSYTGIVSTDNISIDRGSTQKIVPAGSGEIEFSFEIDLSKATGGDRLVLLGWFGPSGGGTFMSASGVVVQYAIRAM